MSARDVRDKLNLPISTRRMQQIFKASSHLEYRKLKASPPLTNRRKENRKKFAACCIYLDPDWRHVVFSDEKKFNLDGSDGFKRHWHDLRKEEKMFSKRQAGGGFCMVWGGFSEKGKTDLAFLSGNQNSEKYVATLHDHLMPRICACHGDKALFQQDRCPCRASKLTKQWFFLYGS